MRLLGWTEQVVAKCKSVENVPILEVIDIVLMHGNVASNNYQQDQNFTFVPDKQLGQLTINNSKSYQTT